MPKVTLVKEKQEIEVPAGANLRDEIRKAGIQVNFFPLDLPSGLLGRTMNCFGHGLCGSCKVLVKEGMENLSQKGTLEKGENIALSGRVYAMADASNGPIKPGDLLTTSATPGHCMKATDHAKAQGAIIGKAMSSLQSGKDMVLVLVCLQ